MNVKSIINEIIPSRLDFVPGFVDAVVRKLMALRLSEDVVFAVKLSLHEAVVNAVRHGNKLKGDTAVHVVVEMREKEIALEVTDQGDGFDFSVIPNPTSEENIGKLHGRGIFLIQGSMDSVEFLDRGRIIRMVKVIK